MNGTAESVARDGLVWTLAPFGIFIGLLIGAFCCRLLYRDGKHFLTFRNFIVDHFALLTHLFTLNGSFFPSNVNVAGLVFARPMRKCEYITMFDPFQRKYHGLMVVLLYFASIIGDLFWAASILIALGL